MLKFDQSNYQCSYTMNSLIKMTSHLKSKMKWKNCKNIVCPYMLEIQIITSKKKLNDKIIVIVYTIYSSIFAFP